MKVLILKLGYSETLDAKIDFFPSLGDVLRTTPILEAIMQKWPKSEITWVTDQAVTPLLKGIPAIARLLTWDSFLSSKLLSEHFDVLINFEKTAAVCILADAIVAKKRFGFHFDPDHGYTVHPKGEEAFQMVSDSEYKRSNQKPWQQMLIEMIGYKWQEQRNQIGYEITEPPKFDVGFNYLVGSKWPNKSWPLEHWKELEKLLNHQGLQVSWQQGSNDLNAYMQWIGSCGLLVTNDSLGLHIALALKRPVLALFGPTSEDEVFFYETGHYLHASTACRPCYEATCKHGNSCMNTIKPKEVYQCIMSQFK